MLDNYLKRAFNYLIAKRSYSLINIIGLTLGISAGLLILVYVVNELSYEKVHKNRKSIYRVAVEFGTDESKMKFAGAMPALAPAIKDALPEVTSAARIRKIDDAVIKNSENREFAGENLFYADPEIFDIFSFEIIQGDWNKLLKDPFSVVISESAAKKYFGEKPPVGKVLYYEEKPFTIEGIMRDAPENTHLAPDLILSYSTLKSLGLMPGMPWNSWGEDLTYILLGKDVQAASILPGLNKLLSDNAGEWLSDRMKFEMQPLDNIHWETDTRGDFGPKGNRTYVYIFLSAAILVLLIACFNFLNLSVSGYLERLKEVAVRKTFGARRKDIIKLFIVESLLMIFVSAILSFLVFDQFSGSLYSYLGMNDTLRNNHFLVLVALISLIVLLTALIAGVYPAFYISKFSPIRIFRKDPQRLPGKLTLRKTLVILQFAISIILISGTTIIYRQLRYINNTDPGFNKENVVILNFNGSVDSLNRYDVFRQELLKNPGIQSVSGAFTVPGVGSRMNISVQSDTSDINNAVIMQALPADFDFVRSLGLHIIQGRDFSYEYHTDKYGSAILNESAVAALALDNPLGAKLMIPGDEYNKGVQVIGVVRDFHLRSFHENMNPLIIYINPKSFIRIAVKVSSAEADKTIGFIHNTWDSVFPGEKFEYRFLGDVYDSLCESEKKSGLLLMLFTVLAVIVAGLGLVGFASLTTAKRIKEVGIRKTLGGRSSGITLLLLEQYAIWILIAAVIACPVSIVLANKWLENFAFHDTVAWWIFPSSAAVVFLVAFLTTGWQSIKAATSNPVEALRYE
ncbi:MAG TPA: ABC transporter permease [Bacteroidales bacterium]|nr:ABC transporter permease [Bacteroidales bacterium]